MKEQLPKLGDHFAQEMINPSMYASQWFITVFSYSFPFHLALRIWDVFLSEVNHLFLLSVQKSNLMESLFKSLQILNVSIFFFSQGVKIVFKVGLALLKYCHDDLVTFPPLTSQS